MLQRHTCLLNICSSHFLRRHTVPRTFNSAMDVANHLMKGWTAQKLFGILIGRQTTRVLSQRTYAVDSPCLKDSQLMKRRMGN